MNQLRSFCLFADWNVVLELAQQVALPREVGYAAGGLSRADLDWRVLPNLLETEDHDLAEFAHGYFWSRHSDDGWQWVEGLNREDWSIRATARVIELPTLQVGGLDASNHVAWRF